MARTRPALTGVFSTPAAPPAAPPTAVRPDRAGRLALPFWATAAAKRQLRILAAEEDTTQQALLTEALNALFTARGLPAVA